METDFETACFAFRKEIEELATKVRSLMDHSEFKKAQSDDQRDPGEMRANIMLTFRHLEDARMRIGKTIQAFDGGASCYPK